MKKLFLFLSVSLICTGLCLSQKVLQSPLSDRLTGYSIKAKLDTESKKIEGEMSCFWVNKSGAQVGEVQLHMYLNAFRDNKSTFYREAKTTSTINEKSAGWIDINSIKDGNGKDLGPSMQYISPDDGNPDDRTVLRVVLPEPAKPGDTVRLDINFTSRLPSNGRRTGYSGDFFFVAQWFPKFGVYEPIGMRYAMEGGWNCHQYHLNSEFYSNHSVYDVEINLPSEYIAGSGGMLINEKDEGEGRKTLTYRAEDIVDFAWTAWPGYAVFTDEWKHVKIMLLMPPERKEQVKRQFGAVKHALQYLEERVGPYPWPHLTFIDPPSVGSFCGGMEYTTLFTSTSSYFMPYFIRMPEMVTVHEFSHSYFMGILANNEFEEPWLDEGVNSYWEARMMDYFYGRESGLIGHPLFKVADKSFQRINYVAAPNRQAVSNAEYSWNYPHGSYSMMSYQKLSVILQTLEGIIGEETMDEIFREYYRQWGFRHPSGKDFINVAGTVVRRMHGTKYGEDLNWYFNQTLYGTGVCDYKVYNLYSREIYSQKKDTTATVASDSSAVYKSYIELERTGDVMLPVDVLIHFDNGDEVVEHWDGKSRTMDYIYTGTRQVQWAKIDPGFKIRLDVNYNNNSRSVKPDRVPIRRIANKMIVFFQFFMSFISI